MRLLLISVVLVWIFTWTRPLRSSSRPGSEVPVCWIRYTGPFSSSARNGLFATTPPNFELAGQASASACAWVQVL